MTEPAKHQFSNYKTKVSIQFDPACNDTKSFEMVEKRNRENIAKLGAIIDRDLFFTPTEKTTTTHFPTWRFKVVCFFRAIWWRLRTIGRLLIGRHCCDESCDY